MTRARGTTTNAISVSNVSKWYPLHEGNASIAKRADNLLLAPLRRRLGRATLEESTGFYALQDISFEVDAGQVLGMIGANGAGKSTMLKIMSRVTAPTTGRVLMRGRPATMLEVGTGFHPELTGRENIYLSGAMLGMRRRDIDRHLDEVIEFSGISQFIDNPVKQYSSGMYARLAFSTSVHLDADILLIDEVLSVGDAEFKRRSREKMEAVVFSGKTIVLVSHDLESIKRLCNQVLFFEKGRLAAGGAAEEIVETYLGKTEKRVFEQVNGSVEIPRALPRSGTGEARIVRVSLRDASGQPLETLTIKQPFRVELEIEASELLQGIAVEIGISTTQSSRIVTIDSQFGSGKRFELRPGNQLVRVDVEGLGLLPHEFALDAAINDPGDGRNIDFVNGTVRFKALNRTGDSGEQPYTWGSIRGHVRHDGSWSHVIPNSAAAERVAVSR